MYEGGCCSSALARVSVVNDLSNATPTFALPSSPTTPGKLRLALPWLTRVHPKAVAIHPRRHLPRAGQKIVERLLQRWPCAEEGQENVVNSDTARPAWPCGTHGRRTGGGRILGPLAHMWERRARGGIVGRSATGAVGDGTKQPPEVAAVFASSRASYLRDA